jgi:hypothetical protein
VIACVPPSAQRVAAAVQQSKKKISAVHAYFGLGYFDLQLFEIPK